MVLCITNLVLFYDIIYNSIDIELTDLCNTKSWSFLKYYETTLTLHSFAYQNVSAWNSLPENVVHCKYSTFKKPIDRIDFLKFLPG